MEIIANVLANTPEAIKELVKPSMEAVSNSGIIVALTLAFVIGIIVVGFTLISKAFSERKSYTYRKLLTDLFVAGTVKKLAKEDGIDLTEEYKDFKKWEKKTKLKGSDLDDAIEVNLRDKVTEKTEIEIDNLGKKATKTQ